jgi:serine/threonine protein kinase
MDRVVLAIDYGEFDAVIDGVQDVVFYLIFDLARGDARVQADEHRRYDLYWSINALRNLAIAITQLHGGRVAHNDIKPANLLVFDELLQKLADLGRATSVDMPGPYDRLFCAGDKRYAAPELLYRKGPVDGRAIAFDRRRASDVYLLGSMAYFFVTGVMLTPFVISGMSYDHRPGRWEGTFSEVLPYWQTSFADATMQLAPRLPADENGEPTQWSKELSAAIRQLCEPDPLRRGHPHNRVGSADPYSLERYVSLFDRLRRRA